MKINIAQTSVAAGIAALISFGFHSFAVPNIRDVITIGSFLCAFSTLFIALGLNFKTYGVKTNIRVIGLSFFLLTLIEHLVFSLYLPYQTAYIIIVGISVLILISLAAGIIKGLKEI
jgi:hypothetical protein